MDMEFKFKTGDLVRINMQYGIFQVVKPIKFEDLEDKNCMKYYVRQVFDKNDQYNIKPCILCHESWIDLLSQNSKLYKKVEDKINLPEIKNIILDPSMEYSYFLQFHNSAFVCCDNMIYKEISKRFEEISGEILDLNKAKETLNEFYNDKKIKLFNILKSQEYLLEKDENVYVVEVGRFVNDYKVEDKDSTRFYRNIRLRKRHVKEVKRK